MQHLKTKQEVDPSPSVTLATENLGSAAGGTAPLVPRSLPWPKARFCFDAF